MKISEMDRNQKTGFYQVVHASNWIVGGYENGINDGEYDKMPSRKALEEEIYDCIMTCTTGEGFQQFNRPMKEIKFCGKDWLLERIDRRLTKMGY